MRLVQQLSQAARRIARKAPHFRRSGAKAVGRTAHKPAPARLPSPVQNSPSSQVPERVYDRDWYNRAPGTDPSVFLGY